jgi:hypothetical protein
VARSDGVSPGGRRSNQFHCDQLDPDVFWPRICYDQDDGKPGYGFLSPCFGIAKRNSMNTSLPTVSVIALALSLASSISAQTAFSFSTGVPNGLIGTGSRPSSNGKTEVESADDFVLSANTLINHATFTGLVTNYPEASISAVNVEIYRVFPQDSTVPPSDLVPSRVNSPSDVVYSERDSASPDLAFSTSVLSATFTVTNSVLNGIHPKPNYFTGGEGPVAGAEVQFDVTLSSAILLPAGHYFFVPQVELNRESEFYWLSSAKPISGGTGPFTPDLQSWIRDESIAPDWLRIGTDITQQGPFNASFSLSGTTLSPVPEPSAYGLLGASILLGTCLARKRGLLRLRRPVSL